MTSTSSSSSLPSGTSTPLSSVVSLPLSLPSRVFSPPAATHALDLPAIRQKPSTEDLVGVLSAYAPKVGSNFIQQEVITPTGFLDWLTRLVGSGLDWLPNDDDRDIVLDLASKRISEQCGRAAAPSMTREFKVGGLSRSIMLTEPSLTADSLGLKTWGSSLLLAQRVADGRLMTALGDMKKRVLELGSGTGLVGITFAALGYSVLLTDLPGVVANLSNNLQSNEQLFLDEEGGDDWDYAVEEIDWTRPEDSKAYKRRERFTTVVVSDPVYEVGQQVILVNALRNFLDFDDADATVIVQLPLRDKFSDVRSLLYSLLAEELGLVPVVVEKEAGVDDFGQGMYLYSVWRLRQAVETKGLKSIDYREIE
ncbi:putative methyltransferase-domain-containing protein [Myxozyma melibiosi]|uniref:Methyltransferase-domain-containing protein n=1 Tax=Myxozyma melibiosi TaxID=54550 RepID=A0ABR1F505_9ASCO